MGAGHGGGGTPIDPTTFFNEERALRLLQQRKQMQIEINTAMFDRGATYTTLIFAAGYAGYFAVWDWTREWMTRFEMLTAALLIGLSLACFIFWQIYSMFYMSRQNVMLGEIVTKPDADFDAACAAYNAEIANLYGRYVRLWKIIYVPTAVLGVAAAVNLVCVIAKATGR